MSRCSGINTLRLLLVQSAALILVACGSGGGSNSTNTGSTNNGNSSPKVETSQSAASSSVPQEATPFSVSFTQSDFSLRVASLTGDENQSAPPTVDIRGQIMGDLPSEEIAFVIVPSDDIFKDADSSLINDSFSLKINPKTDLWPGEYEGSFLIYICPDLECTETFGQSPYEVLYTITYTPESWYARPTDSDIVSNLTDFESILNRFNKNFKFSATTTEGASQATLEFDYAFPSNATNMTFPEELYDTLGLQLLEDNTFTIRLPEITRGLYSYSFDVSHMIGDEEKKTTFTIEHTILPVGVEQGNAAILSESTSLSLPVNTANGTPLKIPVYVPAGQRRLLASPDCDWLAEESFNRNDSTGFFEYNLVIDNKDQNAFSIGNSLPSAELDIGNYSCTISFSYNGSKIGEHAVTLGISGGYAFNISSFAFSQYETASQPQTFEVLSKDSPIADKVRWTLSGIPDWLVVDPKWLTPGQSAPSFEVSVRLTPELLAPSQTGNSATAFIQFEDESNILEDTLLSIRVYTVPVGLKSVAPAIVKVGEPFALTVKKDSAVGTNVSLLRIQKKGQAEGVSGILDIDISLSSGNPLAAGLVEFDLSVGMINEPGVYELFSLTPTEESSDLSVWFSERLEFEVIDDLAEAASSAIKGKPVQIQLKNQYP